MSADTATYRAAEQNTPTTTNQGSKRNLLRPARRVVFLIFVLIRLGIDVIGMQEVGTITRTIFRLHPAWIYLAGGVNSMMPRNRKGSALALRRAQFEVLARRGIRVSYAAAWRRKLKQPRVLTADADTGQRVLWIVAHPPRRKEVAAQRRVLAAVASACQAATGKDIAVVVLIDTNNLALAREILGNVGMRLAESADVQAIFVNDLVTVTKTGVDKSVAGVITDHRGGLPWADLQLHDAVNTTATRIPV